MKGHRTLKYCSKEDIAFFLSVRLNEGQRSNNLIKDAMEVLFQILIKCLLVEVLFFILLARGLIYN